MRNYVLVVDDEHATVDLMRIMLRSMHMEVQGVFTGAEGVTMATIDPPAAILLDLMLPDMTGFEVCRTLKANPQTALIPIIMFTAMHDDTVEQEARLAGVSHFLRKPVARAVLHQIISTAVSAQNT